MITFGNHDPQSVDEGVDTGHSSTQSAPLLRAAARREQGASVIDQVLDLDSVWTAAITGLGEDLVSAQQRAWLRMTKPLALVQGAIVLATPNDFARDVLDTRLRPLVVDALSRELDQEIRVAVTVD